VAGTRWDAHVAWASCAALSAVLFIEFVTPNDVVASLALIPLVAGMWALSTRLAVRVALVSGVVFALILATEAANRPTVVFIVAVAVILASAVRFYATALSGVWPLSRPPSIVLDAGSGVDCLTRRELEVATLASRGYTAVEIGSRLHISDRTVESHLANAYAKLAIHSRSGLRELAELLN
jgi:DNA-binding CsgD family transcriptional regulator